MEKRKAFIKALLSIWGVQLFACWMWFLNPPETKIEDKVAFICVLLIYFIGGILISMIVRDLASILKACMVNLMIFCLLLLLCTFHTDFGLFVLFWTPVLYFPFYPETSWGDSVFFTYLTLLGISLIQMIVLSAGYRLGKWISTFFLIVIIILSLPSNAQAFNDSFTHPAITEQAWGLYQSSHSADYPLSVRTINDKLCEGSINEDRPVSRSFRHFYNPVTSSGLKPFANAKDRALDSSYENSLPAALESYQQESYVKSFEKTGHFLHLIEDMSVPAHTLLDKHPVSDTLENYCKPLNNIRPFLNSGYGYKDLKYDTPQQLFDYGATFSSQNFFSDDSLYCELEGKQNIQKLIASGKATQHTITADNVITARGPAVSYREFIKTTITDSWGVRHNILLAENSYFAYIGEKPNYSFHITSAVAKDYASVLIPEATNQAANAIDLFLKQAQAKEQLQVAISQVDKPAPNSMSIFVNVADCFGRPVKGLTLRNFKVRDSNVAIDRKNVTSVKAFSQNQKDFSLVLDCSGSMKGEPIKQAGASLLSFLSERYISTADRVSIVRFSNSPETLIPLQTGFNREKIRAALNQPYLMKGTAFYDALVEAINTIGGGSERNILIAYSDGDDNRSRATVDKVISTAKKQRVSIYAIGVGQAGRIEDSKKIARETGGEYYYVSSPDQLQAVYTMIASLVKEEYKIDYYKGFPDSIPRLIEIEAVSGQKHGTASYKGGNSYGN